MYCMYVCMLVLYGCMYVDVMLLLLDVDVMLLLLDVDVMLLLLDVDVMLLLLDVDVMLLLLDAFHLGCQTFRNSSLTPRSGHQFYFFLNSPRYYPL